MIEVKVMKVPGAVRNVALQDGATVDDALVAAEMSVDTNQTIQVDGSAASGSTTLTDGSRVIIAAGAKGN